MPIVETLRKGAQNTHYIHIPDFSCLYTELRTRYAAQKL